MKRAKKIIPLGVKLALVEFESKMWDLLYEVNNSGNPEMVAEKYPFDSCMEEKYMQVVEWVDEHVE